MNRHLNWLSFHWKWKRMPMNFFFFIDDVLRLFRPVRELTFRMHFSMLTINFPVLLWCQNHSNAIATMRDSFGYVWVEWLSMYTSFHHQIVYSWIWCERFSSRAIKRRKIAVFLFVILFIFILLEQSSPCLKSERFESQWTTHRPIHAYRYIPDSKNIAFHARYRERDFSLFIYLFG